jgi:hypothetical protein
MGTPLHPNASWNPAFRPDSDNSLPAIAAIAAAHTSTARLHNVTPSAASLEADEELRLIPLTEGRDLEAGMLATRQLRVKTGVRDLPRWFFGMVVLFFTVSLGTCYTFG